MSLKEIEQWGAPAKEVGNRKKVNCLLNLENIKRDAIGYVDQKFIQDLEYGGNANLEIPFKSLVLTENYRMEEAGAEKLRGKLSKESQRDI